MRYIGFSVIILCGLISGLEKYSLLRSRVNILTELIKLFHAIEIKINYASEDIKTIIENTDNAIADKIKQLLKSEEDVILAWEKAGELLFTNNEDRALFIGFIEDFGNMDIESQCKTTEKYIKETEMRRDNAIKDLNEKGKTKVIFSLFFAVTVAILLI